MSCCSRSIPHNAVVTFVSETTSCVSGGADASLLPEFCGPGFSLGGSMSLFGVCSFSYT
jgi:hypothetical protein